MRLAQEMMRAAGDEPQKMMVMNPNTLRPITYARRRVGRPIVEWYREALRQMWKKFPHVPCI